MSKLQQLTDTLYDAALPSSIRVPGMAGSTALERVFGMLVAQFLGWNDETTLSLLTGGMEDTVPMRFGVAFAASVQVNTGNRYGVVAIIHVLKSFSNTEVTPQEAELLQLLEKHVKAAGGKFIPDIDEVEH
jgi:hypothetical protein